MVRWAHKTMRNAALVIGATRYIVDSCGVIATADGDDPAPAHIAVMRNIDEFTQVKVESPAKPAKAPETAPVAAPEPLLAPEPPPVVAEKPKFRRGRRASTKKQK